MSQNKKNKAVILGKKEDDLHLVCKILLQKKLLEKGYNTGTEIPVKGFSINKVVDVVDDSNRIMFEIEKSPTKDYEVYCNKLARELDAVSVVISLRKIPKEIKESVERLAKILEGFVT